MTDQKPFDRVPPSDEEAERCLLGSMLMDHETCRFMIPSISEKAFYLPNHQKIFKAIQALNDESIPADAVLVLEQLQKDGQDNISPDYLANLLESVPSASHAEYYYRIIKDKATLREIISACTGLLQDCYSRKEDAESLVDRAGEVLLNLSMNRTMGESAKIYDVLKETFDQIEKLRRGEVAGLRTGFIELDKMLTGLQDSELIIIAGRPSMGKTSLVMNIATRIAIQEAAPVAIFSLEVNKRQLAQNMLCAEARVNAQQVRTGRFNEFMLQQLLNGVGRLSESPIFIQDTSSLGISELRAQARRLKHQHDIKLLIIDYLQLMEGSKQRNYEGREKEISFISRGLKSIARELEIPVIALSQLSRQVESREGNRPRMSDLRESGSLEQDADVILLLFREGYYKQQEENRKAEIIVAKQRNGPTGNVELVFNREYLRFDNPTAEDIM